MGKGFKMVAIPNSQCATASNAEAKIFSASSSSDALTTSGGIQRMTLS